MAGTIGTLAVGLIGNVSNLTKSLAEGKTQVQGFAQSTQEAGKAVSDTGDKMSMWVTGPIVAATTAIVALAVSVGNFANDLFTMSSQTGFSTDSLQEWTYAATQAGSSADTIYQAIRNLTQRLPQFQIESSQSALALSELGLSFDDIKDMHAEQMFDLIMQRLLEIPDQFQRNTVAAQIFGRGWTLLAPVLSEGADSINALKQEAHDLGIVISEEGLQTAEDFRREWDSAKSQISAMTKEMGISFIPLLQSTFIPLLQNTILPGLRSLVEWIGKIVQGFLDLPAPVQKVSLAVLGLVTALGPMLSIGGRLITTFGTLWAVMLANPILAITALIVAIGTAFYTLWNTSAAFRDFWEDVWLALKHDAEVFVNFFVGAINSVIDGINLLIHAINLIPGINIGDIGKLGDVDFTPTITALQQIERALDNINNKVGELPSDRALDQWKQLTDGIIDEYGSLYPQLEGMRDDFLAKLEDGTYSTLSEMTKDFTDSTNGMAKASDEAIQATGKAVANVVETTANALETQNVWLHFALEDMLTQFGVHLAPVDTAITDLNNRFGDIRDTLNGLTEGSLAYYRVLKDQLFPLYDQVNNLLEDSNLLSDAAVKSLKNIKTAIEEIAPTLRGGATDYYTWAEGIADFTQEVADSINNLGNISKGFLEGLRSSFSSSLGQLAKDLLDFHGVSEQETQDHEERLQSIRDEYAEKMKGKTGQDLTDLQTQLDGALTKEEDRFQESKTTIVGIVETAATDLATAIRNQAIDLAAQWVVDQFVAMAAGIETAMAGANTAAGIGVSNLLTTLAPLTAVLGAIAVVLDISSGKANIAGAIGHWLDSIFFPDAMKKNTVYKNGIPQYGSGGIVAGALGEPQLIVAHGGEPIGAAGLAEAMDYNAFAQAVRMGMREALTEAGGRPIQVDVRLPNGTRLAQALYDPLEAERARRGG